MAPTDTHRVESAPVEEAIAAKQHDGGFDASAVTEQEELLC
jgi:hypothetical protein